MVWCSCSDGSAGDVGTFCLVASQRTDPGDITAIDGLESARCRIARNAHPQLLRFACGESGRGTRQKRLRTAEDAKRAIRLPIGATSAIASLIDIPTSPSHSPIPHPRAPAWITPPGPARWFAFAAPFSSQIRTTCARLLASSTSGCQRKSKSESGDLAKRACCSTAPSLIWHRKDAPTNPRGIPFAPFVDKVEDYVSSRSEVDGTMKSFQEMIS